MLRLIESARESLTGHTRRDAAVEQDHGLAEAQRIFEAGLRCCELREADLPTLRKGDARKLAIAGVIRKRTAVPNAWIASMLHLGHASRISRAARAAAENKWVERLEGFLAK